MQPTAVITAAVVETRYEGHQSASETRGLGMGWGGDWGAQDQIQIFCYVIGYYISDAC